MTAKNFREFDIGPNVTVVSYEIGGLRPGFYSVDVTSMSDFMSGLTVYCGNTSTHHVVMRAAGNLLCVVAAWPLSQDYGDAAIKHILSMAEAHFALTTPNVVRLAKREVRAGAPA